MWIGPVVIPLVMFVIGPFLLFVGGGLLSAIYGWLFPASADDLDAAATNASASPS
jgi:hypothetical protein